MPKLEPDENLIQFACRFGIGINEIWNHPNNEALKKKYKSPWFVGPDQEIFVPDNKSARRIALSGKLSNFIKVPPPDIIEVHLGFMDEEVNARLAELIKKEKNSPPPGGPRPVVLIERGKLDKNKPILEWRVGNYKVGDSGTPIKKIIHISPKGIRDAEKDKDSGTRETSPKPPKIPSPPPVADSIRQSEYGEVYEEWKKNRDDVVMQTPSDQIILWELQIIQGARRGPGTLLSDRPPEPPLAVRGSARNARWLGDFEQWKMDTRALARKWPRMASDWKKEKQGWESEEQTLAPEDILARAMAVYMEQDGEGEKELKDSGVTFMRAFDLLDLIQHRGHPKTKSKLPKKAGQGGGPWLSVVRFDVGPDKYEKAKDIKPPVVVIRTPEMGLQPSLMRPYTEFLFKAISLTASQLAATKAELAGQAPATSSRDARWDIWEWPLQVFQFGAQGSSSIQEKYKPGKIVTVFASLFVGVDIDKNGGIWSVISLSTPASIYDFVRGRINNARDFNKLLEAYDIPLEGARREEGGKAWDKAACIEAAQDAAARIYRAQADSKNWDKLKLQDDKIHKDESSPYASYEKKIQQGLEEKLNLKQVIEEVRKSYDPVFNANAETPGVVTLTVSYFGGEDDKAAADTLGIFGVNMEDFHILRVVRSAFCQGIWESSDYPLVLGWRVDRIQCDPKHIEKDLIKAFLECVQAKNPQKTPNALMTVEDYADIIIWGLKGLLTTAMPECIRWSFIDHYWGQGEKWQKLIKDHFWSYTAADETFTVPDPFGIEIATDFLKELMEIKATDAERGGGRGGLSAPGGIAGVENFLKTEQQLLELRKLAENVQKAWDAEDRGGSTSGGASSESEHPADGVREIQYKGPAGTKAKNEAMKLARYIAGNCDFALKMSDGSYLLSDGRILKPDQISAFDSRKILMKTWLRPGKWGLATNPVKAPTTQDLASPEFSKPEFDGACVDRAFYKSCNMLALQTMAWRFWAVYRPHE